MKRLILMIILLIVLVGTSIAECFYITSTFDFLESEIKTIEVMLKNTKENIDTKENIGAIKTLHEKWHKKTKLLKILVWHTGIKEVEVGLSRALSYTEENNYTEAKVELQNLLDFCEHYEQDFKVSLENIF